MYKEDIRNGFEIEDEYEDVLDCNGCGNEIGRGGFRCCVEYCGFRLHEFCASLPKEMKDYPKHPQHSLILHTNSPYPNSGYGCDVCRTYYPSVTQFCYHCAVCKDPIIETFEEDQINDKLIQFPLPSSEAVQNTLAQFIKNISQWKDAEDQNGDILNHPSHDHPLTLEFDLRKFTNFNYSRTSTRRREYEVCNGCMLPLLNDAPFYSCNESTCKFDLHKWCAKLPRELKHPGHTDTGHILILQEKMDPGLLGIFVCQGCQMTGNGFAYKCNECEEYYLDVKCAALPRLVNYETHKHPLILKYGRSIGGCISCGLSNFFEEDKSMYISAISSFRHTYFTFGCDACNFSIHPKCLILPREIVYWYDKHGFKLIDPIHVFMSNYDQGASTYHCEFCEREVHSESWMYNCFECDQCVDADCVRELFGLFPDRFKIGGQYHSPRHKHPLTSIMPDLQFVCNRCNESPCQVFGIGIGYECRECKIVFCITCAF
ncbi:uncharacterized protein LOC124935280 [Impatiens glandulifera]|uniref:uncharacterized protein LOC124935280 n=1 Tax=Impatiens glandulifera TaxID=253017 RepID=UPI001FB153C7|nr:uncharacterized protein LOC124935280 [Impatiens glandulifera]